MVNKAILVGRVGANPELKNLDGGNKVTNFSIATSEYFKDKAGVKQQKTEWHNIVAWGTLAEIIAKNVVKGSEIYLEGKMATRTWDDKDGVKRYTTEIVANEIKFLGSKKHDDGEVASTTASSNSTTTAATTTSATKTPGKAKEVVTATVTTTDDSDDDLPF